MMFTTRALLSLFTVAAVYLAGTVGVAKATTIVVARSTNEIVIGADSKVTDTYGNELGSEVCKIQQVGNLFLAFEGLWRDKATGFSVPQIAARALQLKPEASVADKVNVLTGFLTSGLFVELQRVRTNSVDEFHTKLEGQTFLRVVIAGFEGNRPLVFVRQFRTTLIARGIGVIVIPDDCVEGCTGNVVTRFMGETEAIEGLPEETPGFWNDGLATGVRRLIETEVAARSEYVGPPIDLLRINAQGAKWIQRKPGCPNVKRLRVRPSPRKQRR